MKNLAIFFLLIALFPIQKLHASDPNPVDYPVTVHVIASYATESYNNPINTPVQRLIAIIDNQRVELKAFSRGVLGLGDYKARRLPNAEAGTPKNPNDYDTYIAYQFLFDDGKT